MKPKAALLIWEEVPEATRLFLLPECYHLKYQSKLKLAHGTFVNGDGSNEGTQFCSYAVTDPKYFEPGKTYEGASVFFEYERQISDGPITEVTITAVYLSGFIL